MENPDVVLEITRDAQGLITGVSYKVHNRTDEGKAALEFLEMMSQMLRPEDHGTYIDVKLDLGD